KWVETFISGGSIGVNVNEESELYCFGNAQDTLDQHMEIFGCKDGEFPFSYLGIPIHLKKLRNADWKKKLRNGLRDALEVGKANNCPQGADSH
ncbi:hypothetical protein U9M48_036997, partial [Paspalum notatum var. saurae]